MMELKYTLLLSGAIKKENNGETWHIPPAPDNTDYQQYLAWVAKGNKPIVEQQPKEQL
jgi:hypothetical protein